MIHWRNLKYIIRHKWLVFIDCCHLGIPWLGVIHDWSKFLPDEWGAYARFFRQRPGYIVTEKQKADFDVAWLKHQHRNKHHWQYWWLINDVDVDYPLQMPDRYIKEMVADWRGASAARGANVRDWWASHGHAVRLHPQSHERFCELLGMDKE